MKPKPPVPLWRWSVWYTALGAALVLFYGLFTPFWFGLRDTEGFVNREAVRYDVRALRDEAPRVVIEEPPNDRDVPAEATVPVEFVVDDDYGIQSARILYQAASGGGAALFVLLTRPWWKRGFQPLRRSPESFRDPSLGSRAHRRAARRRHNSIKK